MKSTRIQKLWFLVIPGFVIVSGCGGNVNGAESHYIDDAGTFSDGSSTSGASGLPCDVANALASCRSCHGTTPTTGTPMSLVTYEDLTRPSLSDPSQSNAQLSIVRMKDPTSTMPPSPASRASAADIAVLESWVAAGTPKGECGDAGPDPFATPPTCTSGRNWMLGDEGSSSMHPGLACIKCHATTGGEAPLYAIAGTVYPTGHEPDDCFSVIAGGGATVVITDATKRVINLTVNSVGNFYYRGSIAKPYTARVEYQGRVRVMAGPQTDGDCNTCHTQTGASSAPGRIILP